MRLPRLRRSDLLLPALIGAVGAVEITAAGYDPVWLTLATFLLAAAVLGAARLAPFAVPPLVTAMYATAALLGVDVAAPASWVPLIAFACLGTGLHAPRSQRFAGLASVLGALAILYAGLEWLTEFEPSLLFGLTMTVGAWALGLALRAALDQNRRAGAEAERARVERALAGQRAVESERERIAVELHDVLAHSLGEMVVQSSVAGDLVRADAGAAATALGAVAQTGREALAETGRLLRLLRDDRDELGLGGGTAPDLDANPEPDAIAASPALPLRDALLPVLFGVIATAEIVSQGDAPLWASLGAFWLAVAVLCARRAVPLAMPIAVVAIFVGARLAGVETDEPVSWTLIGALAYFSAGRHVPRSRAGWGLASVLASIGVAALDAVARERTADAVLVLAAGVGPWVVGVALRETLERTRALAAQTERERLEQELEAERAAAAERKRIARELHDVLANSLSVMIVQAYGGAALAAGDPDGAAAAVSEVERSGRSALGEIGRLLRLIQDGGNEVGTRPQHGVADVPALAEEYTRAGLRVHFDLDGVTRLPIGVDLSTYRIVQEGLTNALKHAPGSVVRVRLAQRQSELAIEVRNDPANASTTAAAVPSGHGLVGLRERVALFGGNLEARPTADGGFVLAATIPVASEEV